jgi:hypothetical protein|tara:strand:- start:305 stop:733 length:429 start_codon:yes stop_codon:yes gene_type:complete
MTKGTKIALITIGVIGTAVGLYFIFKKPNNGKSEFDEEEEEENNSPTTYINNDFPLKKGSGDIGRPVKRVEALQKWLNKEGWAKKLVEDGKFGNNTQEVWDMQQDPFSNFKTMWPSAIQGKVDKTFYETASNGDGKTMKDYE